MAEARRLNGGRWRIYLESERRLVRHPKSGAIATFYSLTEASRWWQKLHPDDPPLREADKCGSCGAYFEPNAKRVTYRGRSYHGVHTPFEIADSLVSSWVADRVCLP